MNNMDKLAELQSERASLEAACKGTEGKNSERERLKLLFDEGSFVEINAFVTGQTPAEGVVSGYGSVNDRLVYAYSQDFSSFGGALGKANSKKISYTLDLAAKMGAPVVSILDSNGAKIAEGIDALASIGEIFAIDLSGFIWLGILCVFHTGFCYWLYFVSLQKMPAYSIAMLSFLDPVSALFFSAVFLNEKMTALQFAGAIIIIGGAMLCEIWQHKKDKQLQK